MGIIKKIVDASKNKKTYKIGLLQAKAHRVLKQYTAKKLVPQNISSMQWAMLGLLYEASSGLKLKVIADELGVEAPFVTQMMRDLSKKGYLKEEDDKNDSRAKKALLTTKGKKFVEETESYLRTEMKVLLKDIGVGDLLSYIQVLNKIVENSEKISKNE